MNSGHTCLFHRGVCTVLFSANGQKAVALTHRVQRKHTVLVKTKEKSKPQKRIPKKKISMKLLRQKLLYSSKRSLLDGDTVNVWKQIYLRVDLDPFCKSCHISTINKKPIFKTPQNPKTPFKWVFMEIIPAIYPKRLTKDTTFANYLLIVDDYSKLPRLYGMENITTEEAMYNIDMFQSRF